MTLTTETVRVQYDGDGATTAFAVTYVFWDADDLQVVLTDSTGVETTWTRGTQYTVSGGSGATGTVTVDTSPTDYTPASGETLTIISNLDNKQNTSLPAGGAFPSASVEEQFDKIVRMQQQNADDLGRALKVAVSESSIDSLPTVAQRASKLLGFDANGVPSVTDPADVAATETVVSTYAKTLLDDADAATARATLVAAGTGAENTFTKTQTWSKGADIASASPLVLGTDGNYFDVTGTTGFSAITVAAGTLFLLQFDGAVTITVGSGITLNNGGSNYTTAAGDHLLGFATAANVVQGILLPTNSAATAGTWTPVLTFATPGDLSVTYSAQAGEYTKIGPMVTAHFNVVTSAFSHSTASGALRLTGLPFSNDGVTPAWGSVNWQGITKTNYTDNHAQVAPAELFVTFQLSGSGQAQQGVLAADMPTGGTVVLRGTVTYRTDS